MTPDIEILKTISEKYSVYDCTKEVLENPKFEVWSGSGQPGQHHYGKGGLAKHTREVVELCLLNANYYTDKKIHLDELVLAAIWHDYGKIWDYKTTNHESLQNRINLGGYDKYGRYITNVYDSWEKANHNREIHHISRSVIEFNKTADKLQLNVLLKDSVTHAILSHHGCREYGSPVSPNTEIAWILHLSDNISARVTDCRTYKYV